MKREELYDNWKKQRSQVEVGYDFTEKVMNRVYQYEQKRKASLFDIQWLVEAITAHPIAKAGLITIGAIIGLARVAFMVHILLFRC
jgi:hypothetical protein